MFRRANLTRALAIAAATALLSVIPVSAAQARACALGHECTTTYYSTQAKTTVVGHLYESCTGGGALYGQQTAYKTWQEVEC